VRYARHFPDPPDRDLAVVGPLPRVGPLLEWRQQLLPHVVVLADRVGADVIGFVDGEPTEEEVVEGSDQVHKGKPGGWSQRRYHERVENRWEDNAEQAAAVVDRIAGDIGARLIVVAGDVRAVQLLEQQLPQETAELVEELGRGANPSTPIEEVSEDVVKLVATRSASDTVTVLEKFREEKGQQDRAADGPRAVFEVLAQGRVETLLVHDDPDDDRTAWFGPDQFHVGLDRATVEAMGVASPTEGRLVDVAIRAALQTSADVRIVPSTTATDGLGAILRYTID
jgi:peptide subunit release factor 1 (eRF1)